MSSDLTCSFIHSLIHSFTHSLTHLLIHSRICKAPLKETKSAAQPRRNKLVLGHLQNAFSYDGL